MESTQTADKCMCASESEGCNAISFKQQRIILKSIDIPKYLHFFYFCCCTGMRSCEALSIKTKNIDKKKRVIHIDMPDSATKKHKRDVPFLPELFDDMIIGKKFLFEDITDEGSKQYFCRLYKQLDFDLTRHSTRHTFISICQHIGIDEQLIQKIAGHTNIKMTQETYTHLLDNGTSPILDYLKRLKKSLKT